MKKLLLILGMSLLLTGCAQTVEEQTSTGANTQVETNETSENEKSENQIVDMAGRTVALPENIDKIFGAEPVSAIYIYQIAPEMLLGWNYSPSDEEKVLILEEYQDLNTYGMSSGINYEAVIADGADLGVISFETANDALFETIDNLEKSIGIPFIAIDSNIALSPEVYSLLGDSIGKSERGLILSDYATEIFESIVEIPEDEQKNIYYGSGVSSLETAPKGSVSSQEIDMLYINNVAVVETSASNRVDISSEQILSWNPDIIILNGEPSEDLTHNQAVLELAQNPIYSNVTAVLNADVYGVPKSPFSFVARPTGPNRLMGIQWLKSVVYPEIYTDDISEVTKEFYSLFYHIDLTDDQVSSLLYQGE